MKMKLFAALTTAILISVAMPAMAGERGDRGDRSERRQQAGNYYQNNHVQQVQHPQRAHRPAEIDRLLKPILALIYGQHDRHYDIPKRHRHDHYRRAKTRHHDDRGQGRRHDHRYFRSARKHQVWHRRNDRRNDRRNRNYRRHYGNG